MEFNFIADSALDLCKIVSHGPKLKVIYNKNGKVLIIIQTNFLSRNSNISIPHNPGLNPGQQQSAARSSLLIQENDKCSSWRRPALLPRRPRAAPPPGCSRPPRRSRGGPGPRPRSCSLQTRSGFRNGIHDCIASLYYTVVDQPEVDVNPVSAGPPNYQ